MKLKLHLLLLTIILIPSGIFSTELPKAIHHFPDDTLAVHPVSCDSITLAYFKKDPFYDYGKTASTDVSFWNTLRDKILRFLSKYFSLDITEQHLKTILWIIAAIVFAGIILLIIIYKPSLFFRNKKQKISFAVEDEDIHELDFTSLIQNALQKELFADAIRWEYLHLLKILDGEEWITWSHHKTVTDYVNEVKDPAVKRDFKELSHQFLYYRYGNFEAFSEDWETFRSLTQRITKQM